jgi:homocysteine S-methyltransferase
MTVLDGGLGSLLESRGHDLTGTLWSARLLIDQPEAIRSAHLDYFAAGAEVAISASYQVSFDGVAALGMTEREGAEVLRLSVELAREARDAASPASLVAASVGPYGAALADGSEYRGDYDLDSAGLRAWHERRFETLATAGADLLAFETIPSTAESVALLDLLRGSGTIAWLSYTVRDGHLPTGETLPSAFAVAAEVDEIVAVGINCSHPDEVLGAIQAARAVSDKAIVVYPNSGETWNATTRSWEGSPGPSISLLESWIEAGATAVGGCCRVGPPDIAQLADALRTRA